MDFLRSSHTNPYVFKNFGVNHFVMYVNGRQIPSKGLSLNASSAKTCTMAYRTLFIGLGIHHENNGIQIMPTQFMKGSFMLIFDLTADGFASDEQTGLSENFNIPIELKFEESLPEAVTVLLY